MAGALLVGALGLWLAGAPQGKAQDSENQGIAAGVLDSISWNPTSCNTISLMGPVDFGDTPSGGTATSLPSVGCVSSNRNWDVDANMGLAGQPNSGTDEIPASAFKIQRVTAGAALEDVLDGLSGFLPTQLPDLLAEGGSSSCTTATACPLDAPQKLIDEADANGVQLLPILPGLTLLNGLVAWQYQLDVPEGQPSGEYTGGVVTLTASND